ncbi:MAG: SDR family oxidoreductase [Betaproteobacteria bacterium AqS2]|uniref:SDR family oxidoreductase n=1 Tax=Candidatus Amphirhobacter heronislandensis TaxID=1732024 RepID=A0A930XY71_9GAMM|nr:SDR family oxidoreductase [Betaproteobacteria bacterium AqS2]
METHASFHDLKDVSVFITGGGKGIGAALTEGFIQQGAKVAFVQRSDATELCDRLEKEHGNRPLALQADISDVAALQDAVKQAAAKHGTIGVLVNNAAWDDRHKTADVTAEYWDGNHAINLRPYFFGVQAVAPGMQELGHGSIINISSISFMRGNSEYPAYMSANCAIMGLTRSFAREYGKDNVRCNAIAPGWVLTERQLEKWYTKEAGDAHRLSQCIPEHLQPPDIVGPVLFLASKASRMLTGQIIPVDGGAVFNSG